MTSYWGKAHAGHAPEKRVEGGLHVASVNMAVTTFCGKLQSTNPKWNSAEITEKFMDDFDVLGIAEVKGDKRSWEDDTTLIGLTFGKLKGYTAYWSRGDKGQQGVGIIIKSDIPHNAAYVNPHAGLTLPEKFKGRLLVLETTFPSRIAFVVIYGVSKISESPKEFTQHVSDVVACLRDKGARPVLLGDFNILPKNLGQCFGPRFNNIFGGDIITKSPRHTYFSNYKDEATGKTKSDSS